MKRVLTFLLTAVCIIMLVVSGYFLISYFFQSHQEQNVYDQLADIVAPSEGLARPEDDAEAPAMPDYSEVYAMNHDMVGWITVPGTRINYPVMQTPDEPNYYLHRSFEKTETSAGCPYLQENCDINEPSDNLIIYGHNMKSGTMFGDLDLYVRQKFWDKHQTFTFDTLTERRTYEVLAVFRTTASVGDESAFYYHHFVNAANEAEFDAFVDQCKRLSLYDTGVSASYGDKLITLSTCEYSHTNGRLVLVGRQISSES